MTAITAFFIIIALWTMIGIDYWRTIYSFEKPIFARDAVTMDDGGSGLYKGIVFC